MINIEILKWFKFLQQQKIQKYSQLSKNNNSFFPLSAYQTFAHCYFSEIMAYTLL